MIHSLLILPLLIVSCNDADELANPSQNIPTDIISSAVNTSADFTLTMSTNKVNYKPGEEITFNVAGSIPAGAKVRYRVGADVISEETVSGNTWKWTAPQSDYTGYMVDVYTSGVDNSETIYGTCAVDVSSSWSRYPRYGFVATYDAGKTKETVAGEMAFLNRCHINGIQFYDWHCKHHKPLAGTAGNPDAEYTDIANRQILSDVVKDYISIQHSYGMKSMFYNLCYGSLSDAAQDGVSSQWNLYTDKAHAKEDKLSLSSDWKSDIYIMDPGNKSWQNYLVKCNDYVYASFDFDGFHIDQVGNRGTVYDYYGSQVNLPEGFASFITAMKTHNTDKSLVMNAVSKYGQSKIAGTKDVDFLYNEMWSGEDKFNDLYKVIKENNSYSNNTLNTVFAAYMNYNKSAASGTFNTPGILLTDAVMFSLGGSHLELGDHMLCHEYFPNSNLKMSEELKASMIHYYDFLTSYEHLLRNGGIETVADVYSGNNSVTVNVWPPKLGTVTAYSKTLENRQVINLLNFEQANSLSWRDIDGTQPEPELITNLPLRIKAAGVKKIWAATPDSLGGVPVELNFTVEKGYVNISLPSLKYWTMIVIEK